MRWNVGIGNAIGAAVLFGASTPFAKMLVGELSPVLLAGLLYAGSGLGLAVLLLGRRVLGWPAGEAGLSRQDMPWFLAAVLAGGVAGPVLLMYGLTQVAASSASLLLNLEGVFTAGLAWVVFRENVDRRLLTGMTLIVVAGLLLSWNGSEGGGGLAGMAAIIGACLCWGVDNNLTRKVSASDPVQIAGIKGLVAGTINLGAAFVLGASLPGVSQAAAALAIGLLGYGVSLVLFVLALRRLGTARTGAYFSLAPFAGAVLSLVLFPEMPGALFWLSALLMGAGIWLHVTERHEHTHSHEVLAHNHAHSHDEHHDHDHDFDWDGAEPHVHFHVHRPLVHSHPHYPDVHHRHRH